MIYSTNLSFSLDSVVHLWFIVDFFFFHVFCRFILAVVTRYVVFYFLVVVAGQDHFYILPFTLLSFLSQSCISYILSFFITLLFLIYAVVFQAFTNRCRFHLFYVLFYCITNLLSFSKKKKKPCCPTIPI